MRKRRGWGVMCGIVLCIAGCRSPHFSSAKDVDPTAWDDPAMIIVNNSDTVILRDIGLFLRSNERFADDTLSLRIRITTPDALRHEEIHRLILPHAESPAAIMREINIDYRRNVRFARSGSYQITITPTRPVKGVEAVGIHIVKSE